MIDPRLVSRPFLAAWARTWLGVCVSSCAVDSDTGCGGRVVLGSNSGMGGGVARGGERG